MRPIDWQNTHHYLKQFKEVLLRNALHVRL